jgi:hypothetical protein
MSDGFENGIDFTTKAQRTQRKASLCVFVVQRLQQPLILLPRTRDQSLDLEHFRDQLAVKALEAGGVDDALRFGADVARILDRGGGPGQQSISISGH